MKRKPPRLAARLLEHFSRNSALIGDLNEEYQQGRSYAWYWSQVLVTVATKIYEDGRFHPILVARGVALGWVLMDISRNVFSRFVSFCFTTFLSEGLLAAPKSRILFYLFRQPSLAWVILFSLPCLAIGWVVARLHRRQHVAAVLLFAASCFIVALQGLPWILHLVSESWTNSRYLPYLLGDSLRLISPPLMIVLGGLYGRQSKAGTISQHQGIIKAE